MSDRGFGLRLGAIVLAGLIARIAFGLYFGPRSGVGGDGMTYHLLANYLADGRGFVDAQELNLSGVSRPSAEHPPLYPLLLSISSLLGGDGYGHHRVVSSLMGSGTVAAVGFLARRVGGDRAGLLAALAAAFYPMLVLTDSTLYSESLYGLTIALALLAAYWYLDRPAPARAIVLGVAIGAAAMTRSEAVLLVVLLGAPVAWLARTSRLRNFALVGAATLIVIAPWTIRSSLALDSPVLLSTNLGGLVAGANCDRTYHGEELGLWSFSCFFPVPRFDNQADLAAHLRKKGTDYALDHPGRWPAVVAARVGRTWDLYRPIQNTRYEAFAEGRQQTASRIGLGVYYLLLALAIYGLVLLRRRGAPLALLLAPVVLVTIMSALGYGVPRFRIPAEIPILVLAGVAANALVARVPWHPPAISLPRLSTRAKLATIIGLAAGLRFLWIALTGRAPVAPPDPAFYVQAASGIASGDGYLGFNGLPTTYFPPGYPYALGGVFWLVRHTPLPDSGHWAAAVFDATLGVVAVGLIYRLGRSLFDTRIALLAAAIAAVFPSLVYYSSAILSETLFIALSLAALVVATARPWERSRLPLGTLVIVGLLVGVAALTRSVGLLILPALGVSILIAGGGFRVALWQTAVATAAAAVVIAPWTIRNAVVMDSPVVIASNAGDDMCIGHNPNATGAFQESIYCTGPLNVPEDRAEILRSKANLRQAWRFARHNPDDELRLLWLRARYTYDSDHEAIAAVESYGRNRFISDSLRGVLHSVANLFFFAVVLLGLAGLRAFFGRDPRRLLVLITLAAFALTPLGIFGNPRFHVPALPLLALAAAVTVTRLTARDRSPASVGAGT